ncbi:C-type lectin domain-containing protein, partial [Citrobacter sp. AAK_AS5]
GGNMFCVTSKQENDSVAVPLTTKYPYSDIWIGLYQDITDPLYSEPNGGWKWVDKSTLNYTNWNDGEPNNSGNENYAVLDY